jgi:hypothetical protein
MFSRQLHSLVLATVAAVWAAGSLSAQEGAVRGRVTDSAGVAIADADVAIVAIHALTRTDAQGRFTLAKVPAGEHEVSVRRLGYRPTTVKALVGGLEYSYEIVLSRQAAIIAGVDVNASNPRLRLGIEEFYRRRARGMGGTFFTRADITARNPRKTTDLLRDTPGLRIVGEGVRFVGKRQCLPALWLDGQEVRGMEIDVIPVTDIEGMELYAGPATTPMQFSHGASRTDCGVIVVWTRIPGAP